MNLGGAFTAPSNGWLSTPDGRQWELSGHSPPLVVRLRISASLLSRPSLHPLQYLSRPGEFRLQVNALVVERSACHQTPAVFLLTSLTVVAVEAADCILKLHHSLV